MPIVVETLQYAKRLRNLAYLDGRNGISHGRHTKKCGVASEGMLAKGGRTVTTVAGAGPEGVKAPHVLAVAKFEPGRYPRNNIKYRRT